MGGIEDRISGLEEKTEKLHHSVKVNDKFIKIHRQEKFGELREIKKRYNLWNMGTDKGAE